MNLAVKVDAADVAAEAYAAAARRAQSGQGRAIPGRHHLAGTSSGCGAEDPVHFTAESEFGPYWSITRWDDIMAVDTNHEAFSSTDGIVLANRSRRSKSRARPSSAEDGAARPRGAAQAFITMDEPDHSPTARRSARRVAPANIAKMAPLVRERAGQILDALPIGEPIRLGRPGVEGADGDDAGHPVRLPVRGAAQAHLLVGHVHQHAGPRTGEELATQGARPTFECFGAFQELWNQRVNAEPGIDLISMLTHNPATRNMSREQYQGTVVLLIIGGNDTTRNTISGSVYALNKNPGPV